MSLVQTHARRRGGAILACSGLALLGGCEVSALVARERPAPGRDAGAPEPALPWGIHAASLDIAPCAAGEALVVDTAAHELDGGETLDDPAQAGAHLSLLEAMWIAANRGGPHNIGFDAAVFPAEAPGRIVLDDRLVFPNLADTCVDARQRGVEISWAAGAGQVCQTQPARCVWRLETGSRLIGLSVDLIYPFVVNNAEVQGCRMISRHQRALELRGTSLIGPGNVFGHLDGAATFPLKIEQGEHVVRDNAFGFDPLTRLRYDMLEPYVSWAPLQFKGNTVCAAQSAWTSYNLVHMEANFFCVDREGAPLPAPCEGPWLNGTGRVFFGPGNTVRSDSAVLTVSTYEHLVVTISRNSISGAASNISFVDLAEPVAPPSPPTLTGREGLAVSGTCSAEGTVELFSDPGSLGETFLAAGACGPDEPWRLTLPAPLPPGRNLTATLTDLAGRSSAFSAPLAGSP